MKSDKKQVPKPVDWDHIPSPNPWFGGLAVLEAVRHFLKSGQCVERKSCLLLL